jgi:hypothetical protein
MWPAGSAWRRTGSHPRPRRSCFSGRQVQAARSSNASRRCARRSRSRKSSRCRRSVCGRFQASRRPSPSRAGPGGISASTQREAAPVRSRGFARSPVAPSRPEARPARDLRGSREPVLRWGHDVVPGEAFGGGLHTEPRQWAGHRRHDLLPTAVRATCARRRPPGCRPVRAEGHDQLSTVGLGAPNSVDDWNDYHRKTGEVHCGSSVVRAAFDLNWWEHLP